MRALTIAEIQENLKKEFEQWKVHVRQHDINYLQTKPDQNSWSFGQVINHVIIETKWYFSQAEKALVDSENVNKSKTETIKKWFSQNSFPDQIFKGPEDIEEPDQPLSSEELIQKIIDLEIEMMRLGDKISAVTSNGKLEHPGHGFLTALEWFQYAEMHCSHHFRQQKRIGKVLNKQR